MYMGKILYQGFESLTLRLFFICGSVGQAVKTPPFHGGNTGSIPVRIINLAVVQIGYTGA